MSGPLRDIAVSERTDNAPTTTLLFVRIWAFCAFNAGLEAHLFSNDGPMYFMQVMSVFGMRFQAQAQHVIRAGSEAPDSLASFAPEPQR